MADIVDSILQQVRQLAQITPEQSARIERNVRALHGGCEAYVRKTVAASRGHGLQNKIGEALRAGVPLADIPQHLSCGKRVVYKYIGRPDRP